MKELDKPFPTILQPLFGRYDFRILPTPGYYDVILNYKMDDNDEENRTKTISSQFIVRKYEESTAYINGEIVILSYVKDT